MEASQVTSLLTVAEKSQSFEESPQADYTGVLVVIIIVQLLFLLTHNLKFKLKGLSKLIVLSFITLIVTILEKLASGLPISDILRDSSFLLFAQISLHQIGKHLRENFNGSIKNKVSDVPLCDNDVDYPEHFPNVMHISKKRFGRR